MILPTWVEPVKFTRFTAGWAISADTTSGASSALWVTKFTTPSPKPASCKVFTSNSWVAGQVSEAFNTTVLPQASGIASARVAKITGAFHGAMPTTTPQGTRIAIAMRPGTSLGITLP